MLRSLRGALAAFSCVALVAGCGQGPLAVVNGEKIGEKQFREELERQAGRDAVAKLIMEEMLLQEAAAQGIVISEERLNEDMRKAMEGAGGPQPWARELERRGHTEESIRRERRIDLTVHELMTKGVTVSEEEIKQFFEENRKDLYDRPALYVISEIAVDEKAEAQRLREELKKPEADFASLARQHSVSGTASLGGRRRPTPLELFRPELLREAISHLELGQVSDVIPADDLWYIVRLEDKTPPVKGSLKDPVIAEDVKNRLMRQKGKSWPDLFQELKEKYDVNILWPEYKFLEEDFASPAALPEFGAGEGTTETGAQPEKKPEPPEKTQQEPAGKPEKKPTTPPAAKPAEPD